MLSSLAIMIEELFKILQMFGIDVYGANRGGKLDALHSKEVHIAMVECNIIIDSSWIYLKGISSSLCADHIRKQHSKRHIKHEKVS